MPNRWVILGVLFLARMSMAAQFQTVAALSPLMMESYGLGLADIGLLIGLYLAPGVVVALPGGAISAWFGDKRAVMLGMAAMVAGGVLIAAEPGQGGLVAARMLSGTGGVVLNVVMTKVLVDWFAGREIAIAMSFFVASWPAGIALALLALPLIGQEFGLPAALSAVPLLIGVCLVLFARVYRDRPDAATDAAEFRIAALPFVPLALAGCVWAFYNVALALVFGFAPVLLTQKGWGLSDAGSATGLFMVVFTLALPLGGWLADLTGRRDAIIAASLLCFAAAMPMIPQAGTLVVLAVLVVVGGVFALAAGPIMTLPSSVLSPSARSFGMGVFLTIYYAVMMIGPGLAGRLADRTGDADVVVFIGAVLSLAALGAFGLYRRTAAMQEMAGEAVQPDGRT